MSPQAATVMQSAKAPVPVKQFATSGVVDQIAPRLLPRRPGSQAARRSLEHLRPLHPAIRQSGVTLITAAHDFIYVCSPRAQ